MSELKVLVVDDSTAVRGRLASHINDVMGVSIVGEARDGSEALQMIGNYSPDVVILDIHLGEQNGIETLRRIKALTKPPVVIMLTNYPHPLYWEACMNEGADCFFDKSTEFLKTLDVLRDLANRKFNQPA